MGRRGRRGRKRGPIRPGPIVDDLYEIKVVGQREVNGLKEVRVHYVGWGSQYDEWKPEAEIEYSPADDAEPKQQPASDAKEKAGDVDSHEIERAEKSEAEVKEEQTSERPTKRPRGRPKGSGKALAKKSQLATPSKSERNKHLKEEESEGDDEADEEDESESEVDNSDDEDYIDKRSKSSSTPKRKRLIKSAQTDEDTISGEGHRKPWTQSEEELLEDAINENMSGKGVSWSNVAAQLSRTPWSCKRQWDRLRVYRAHYKSPKELKKRRTMIKKSHKRPWTAEEEEKLIRVVAERGLTYDSEVWVSLEKEFQRSAGALQLRWSELHNKRGGAVNLESDAESSLDFDESPRATKSRRTSRKLFASQEPTDQTKETQKEPEDKKLADNQIEEDQEKEARQEGEEEEEDKEKEEGDIQPKSLTASKILGSSDDQVRSTPGHQRKQPFTVQKPRLPRSDSSDDSDSSDSTDDLAGGDNTQSRKTTSTIPRSGSRSPLILSQASQARLSGESLGKEREDEEDSQVQVTERQKEAMRLLGDGSPIISSDHELSQKLEHDRRRETAKLPEDSVSEDEEPADSRAVEERAESSKSTGRDDLRQRESDAKISDPAALREWVERKRQENFLLYGQLTISPVRTSRTPHSSRKRRHDPTEAYEEEPNTQRTPKRSRTESIRHLKAESNDVDAFLMGKEKRPDRNQALRPGRRSSSAKKDLRSSDGDSEWQVIFGPGHRGSSDEEGGQSRRTASTGQIREDFAQDEWHERARRNGPTTEPRKRSKGLVVLPAVGVARSKRRAFSLGTTSELRRPVEDDSDEVLEEIAKKVDELRQLLARKRREDEERRKRREEARRLRERERIAREEEERERAHQVYLYWQARRGRP